MRLLSICALLLCACTQQIRRTPEDDAERAKLAAWVGKDIKELVAKAGQPYLVKPSRDGLVMYQWRYLAKDGERAYWTNAVSFAPAVGCVESFYADAAGHIVHWRWSGYC